MGEQIGRQSSILIQILPDLVDPRVGNLTQLFALIAVRM